VGVTSCRVVQLGSREALRFASCRHEFWVASPACGVGVVSGPGGFGQVSAIPGLPLVVRFHQHGARQAQERLGVGEHPDRVGAAFDFLVRPLQRVVGG
jgi:hypothetical protein